MLVGRPRYRRIGMNSAFTTTLTVGLFAVAALLPLRPRRSSPFTVQFALSWWMNELPFIGLWWLTAGTLGTLLNPQPGLWWWFTAGLTAAVASVLVRILVRARSARPALAAAFSDVYGVEGTPHATSVPWWRIILLPIVAWRPDVRRIRNRRYGPAAVGNLVDVYVSRRRDRPDGAPVLLYLHGGGLNGGGFGGKSVFAHALLYRFAAEGWVCLSANYRMRVGYRDQVADAREALDWARSHAEDFGGDPASVIVAGGSSGANLAAASSLTGAPVRGVIGLYGFYGAVGPGSRGPAREITPDAPPFLVIHGSQDTLVRREDARGFAERLRALSRQPVVYAELPGTNHNFDFFPSLRLQAVGDAIARFTELTLEAPATTGRR
jgi:acetyl esterase/lipase